jgi:putative transcriptional regulator
MENRAGKYLVARPVIQSGFFKQSVVFIYEDNPLGATTGLALHSRTNLKFSTVAEQFGCVTQTLDDYIYKGGPVNENSLLMLHTPDFESSNTLWTQNNLCVSSDAHMVRKLSQSAWPNYYKLVTGVCVWAGGQLDNELERNNWLLCDLPTDMVFTLDGLNLWNTAIDIYSTQIFDQYL